MFFFAERPFPFNSYGNGVFVHTYSVGTVAVGTMFIVGRSGIPG